MQLLNPCRIAALVLVCAFGAPQFTLAQETQAVLNQASRLQVLDAETQHTERQDPLVGLAQVVADTSRVVNRGTGATLSLTLSQPIPYRIFTLTDPMRLVIDFSEVDWTGFNPIRFDQASQVTAVRVGGFRPGWSRMVMDLEAPLTVDTAQLLRTDQGASLFVSLSPIDADGFAESAGVPASAQFPLAGKPADLKAVPRVPIGTGPLRIVLDPGHGGIDPGAERDGIRESDLMLTFAQELRDILVRSGGFDVVLTRNDDSFVPLETRISIARAVAADVFLSLHADALSEGYAEGAAIYTLAERASDEASIKLAERHDRADLLAGVDLSDHDDVIASVLLDMARTETVPRTGRLATALVERLDKSIGMHKRPRMEAGFSVLKSADVPSVLLELGFLSSAKDRANLLDSDWRATAAVAIKDALMDWMSLEQQMSQKVRN